MNLPPISVIEPDQYPPQAAPNRHSGLFVIVWTGTFLPAGCRGDMRMQDFATVTFSGVAANPVMEQDVASRVRRLQQRFGNIYPIHVTIERLPPDEGPSVKVTLVLHWKGQRIGVSRHGFLPRLVDSVRQALDDAFSGAGRNIHMVCQQLEGLGPQTWSNCC